MGKKQLDRTAHDGHLVVSTSLADALTAEGLGGFSVRSVRRAHLEHADSAYRWLHIAFEWPQMATMTGLTTDDLCPQCRRTGYFDADSRLEPWRYAAAPTGAADFGLTWERFGYWRGRGWEPGLRGVGGQGGLIISDRARAVLESRKVHYVEYIPVVFEAGT
jgi:hypothetical protein